MGKEGHYAPWYLGAATLIIVGSALMYIVDENTSTARIYGYSIILAAGAGCIIQTGFIVSQAVVPRSEMSSGKHCVLALRQYLANQSQLLRSSTSRRLEVLSYL